MHVLRATDIQALPVVGLFTVAITSGLHDHLQPHSYPHTTIPPTQLPSHNHTPHTATLTRPYPPHGYPHTTIPTPGCGWYDPLHQAVWPTSQVCWYHHRCAGTVTGVPVHVPSQVCWYHHRCAGAITGVLVPSQVCWYHHRCAGTITGVLVPSQVCWYHHSVLIPSQGC